MNILVKTWSGRIIVRPDTTLKKNSEDVYPQDEVEGFSFVPILFARVCKAGRSIGRGFASRYYDAVNYGLLLYPDNFLDGTEEGFACASCLDHTTFLPMPMYNPAVLGNGNEFRILKDGKEIYSTVSGSPEHIEDILTEATSRIFIRTGDIMAIELAPRTPLTDKKAGRTLIQCSYCGNPSLDFNIVF